MFSNWKGVYKRFFRCVQISCFRIGTRSDQVIDIEIPLAELTAPSIFTHQAVWRPMRKNRHISFSQSSATRPLQSEISHR